MSTYCSLHVSFFLSNNRAMCRCYGISVAITWFYFLWHFSVYVPYIWCSWVFNQCRENCYAACCCLRHDEPKTACTGWLAVHVELMAAAQICSAFVDHMQKYKKSTVERFLLMWQVQTVCVFFWPKPNHSTSRWPAAAEYSSLSLHATLSVNIYSINGCLNLQGLAIILSNK